MVASHVDRLRELPRHLRNKNTAAAMTAAPMIHGK
jgi:hypothetical protein